MIKITCSTPKENYDCSLVKELSCKPSIGEMINVLYINKGGEKNPTKLQIVEIIHSINEEGEPCLHLNLDRKIF